MVYLFYIVFSGFTVLLCSESEWEAASVILLVKVYKIGKLCNSRLFSTICNIKLYLKIITLWMVLTKKSNNPRQALCFLKIFRTLTAHSFGQHSPQTPLTGYLSGYQANEYSLVLIFYLFIFRCLSADSGKKQ